MTGAKYYVSLSPTLSVAMDKIIALEATGERLTTVHVEGVKAFNVRAYMYEIFDVMQKALEMTEETEVSFVEDDPEEAQANIRVKKGLDYFSETVRMKARSLSESPAAALRDEEAPGVWWVRPDPSKKYRVQIHEASKIEYGATCTCPNGLNRARAECYHAALVLLRIKEGY